MEPEAIANPEIAKFAWIFILCFDLIIVGTLTASPNTHRAKLMNWTSSSEGRLFSVIIFAFLIAMFLVFLRLFGYVLVLSLSLMLARLDMLAAGFSDLPVLIVLLLISLMGFGVGWLANHHIQSPLERRYRSPIQTPSSQAHSPLSSPFQDSRPEPSHSEPPPNKSNQQKH